MWGSISRCLSHANSRRRRRTHVRHIRNVHRPHHRRPHRLQTHVRHIRNVRRPSRRHAHSIRSHASRRHRSLLAPGKFPSGATQTLLDRQSSPTRQTRQSPMIGG